MIPYNRRFQEKIEEDLVKHLIFDAPLAQGDLSDHISGKLFVSTMSPITWNAGAGMYLFAKSGTNTGGRVSSLNLGLDFSNGVSNVNCTLLQTIRLTAMGTGHQALFSLNQGSHTSTIGRRVFALTPVYISLSINTTYKIAIVIINGQYSVYVDGVEVIPSGIIIDTDSISLSNNHVSICAGNWNGNDGSVCAKDLKIYNIPLTLKQIKKIQDI